MILMHGLMDCTQGKGHLISKKYHVTKYGFCGNIFSSIQYQQHTSNIQEINIQYNILQIKFHGIMHCIVSVFNMTLNKNTFE